LNRYALYLIAAMQQRSLSVWSLVLWYGLSASVFSFWLWMKGIRHVDGSLAGVFCGLLPIAAALYGIVLPG